MKELMAEIQETTKKQKSASRVDEVRVMRTMLNDPKFEVSIYDRNKGKIGTRSPREEAIKFVASTASAVTGLDAAQATELAQNYEFTKKDASLIIRHVDQKTKKIPDNMGGGTATVPAFDKVISKSKSPKYNK